MLSDFMVRNGDNTCHKSINNSFESEKLTKAIHDVQWHVPSTSPVDKRVNYSERSNDIWLGAPVLLLVIKISLGLTVFYLLMEWYDFIFLNLPTTAPLLRNTNLTSTDSIVVAGDTSLGKTLQYSTTLTRFQCLQTIDRPVCNINC